MRCENDTVAPQRRRTPLGRPNVRPLLVCLFLLACGRKVDQQSGSAASSTSTLAKDSPASKESPASSRPDTLPHIIPETLEVSPRDAAAITQVSQTESYRIKVDSILRSPAEGLRFFARLGKEGEGECIERTDSIVTVPDPKHWPDNTETSFILLVDNGHVLATYESPVSCSGDWNNTYTHVFDTAGNTVSFQRFSGFFNGCPFTAHEVSTYYFEPVTGRLLAKKYLMTDHEGKPFSPSRCDDFYYRHDYLIFANWRSAAKAFHLPAAIP